MQRDDVQGLAAELAFRFFFALFPFIVPNRTMATQVLIFGLREWRVDKALQAYKRGEGSLAYPARQAGISLREMILLAYAHGLTPKVDPADLEISES